RGQEWRPWAHARQERRDSALTRPRPPVPSVALDFLQLHPEAAGVVALVADPCHLRVRGVRSAIDRAGDFPAGSHAQLAQAIAGLAAATVLRVVDRGWPGSRSISVLSTTPPTNRPRIMSHLAVSVRDPASARPRARAVNGAAGSSGALQSTSMTRPRRSIRNRARWRPW